MRAGGQPLALRARSFYMEKSKSGRERRHTLEEKHRKLSTREFCELQGTLSVAMISAEGTLQMFGG
jgi:hypothetical protein